MKKILILLMFFLSGNIYSQITITGINVTNQVLCLGNSGNAIVQVSPNGSYFYQWQFAGNLGSPTASSTSFQPTSGGYQELVVVVTDGFGGYATDTVIIEVHDLSNVNVTATPGSVYCSDSVQLSCTFSGGGSTPVGIGTISGANTAYTYPAPFGNWYANEKQQFLYHASELIAQGISAGPISGINFPVTTMGGLTTYPAYTVKMGHTTTNALTTTFLSTDPTPYYSANTTVQTGNNIINFTSPFVWNGTDNIVVEICYTWTAQYNYTTNAISPWVTTSFYSSAVYNSDGTVACPMNTSFSTSYNRPYTEFIISTTAVLDSVYYSWTPTGSLDDPTSATPIATPTTNTTYTVSVTDLVCSGTDNILVTIDNSVILNPSVLFPGAICQNSSQTYFSNALGAQDYMWVLPGATPDTVYTSDATVSYYNSGTFNYTLYAYNNCGGSDVATGTIQVLPAGAITINPATDTFCINSVVMLDANLSAANTYSWNYEVDGTPYSQTGPIFWHSSSVVGSDTITFSAYYSSCGGTVDSTFILYFIDCLGVDDYDGENSLFLLQSFPDYLKIISNNELINEIYLFDLSGRLLQSASPNSMAFDLNTENYSSAIYIIEITTNNGSVRKKFYKNK